MSVQRILHCVWEHLHTSHLQCAYKSSSATRSAAASTIATLLIHAPREDNETMVFKRRPFSSDMLVKVIQSIGQIQPHNRGSSLTLGTRAAVGAPTTRNERRRGLSFSICGVCRFFTTRMLLVSTAEGIPELAYSSSIETLHPLLQHARSGYLEMDQSLETSPTSCLRTGIVQSLRSDCRSNLSALLTQSAIGAVEESTRSGKHTINVILYDSMAYETNDRSQLKTASAIHRSVLRH